jgi:Domain of unknown function (DUF4129)
VPTVDIDRETAYEVAQRELNKPIYPRSSLRERFSEWLNELIYRIVAKGSTIPGGWFTIAVLLIIVAVAVVVAVRVARKTMRTDRGTDYALFGPADRSAAEHRATAEQYAARGEWAAAIRHRLRAVARQLEESGVLDPVPGRTSYELARAAGASIPLLAGEFLRAATAFNDVTFGERPGTPAAYRLTADLDEHLRSRQFATAPAAPTAPTDDTWAEIR